MPEQSYAKPLKIIIPYQVEKPPLIKNDAYKIAEALTAMGHEVTLANVAEAQIVTTAQGECLLNEGQSIPLSSFDGATLLVRPDMPECVSIREALHRNNVAIYHDLPMLSAGCDKLQSQEIFDQKKIPTPRTYGVMWNQPESPEAFEAFVAQLMSPFVIKKSYGWNGDLVAIVESRAAAKALFHKWREENKIEGKGGVLFQEYIESNKARRRDYRIHTIVGVDENGQSEAKIVAASARIAQPGVRVTNVVRGAEKIRVSLDEAEARAFYVAKDGMPEAEFEGKIKSGEIKILSPALRKFAMDMALAFGPGSLGLDIIVGEKDKEPKALEVNPFAGGSGKFETQYGFDLYRPWAEALAGYVAYEKNKAIPSEAVKNATGSPALLEERTRNTP